MLRKKTIDGTSKLHVKMKNTENGFVYYLKDNNRKKN